MADPTLPQMGSVKSRKSMFEQMAMPSLPPPGTMSNRGSATQSRRTSNASITEDITLVGPSVIQSNLSTSTSFSNRKNSFSNGAQEPSLAALITMAQIPPPPIAQAPSVDESIETYHTELSVYQDTESLNPTTTTDADGYTSLEQTGRQPSSGESQLDRIDEDMTGTDRNDDINQSSGSFSDTMITAPLLETTPSASDFEVPRPPESIESPVRSYEDMESDEDEEEEDDDSDDDDEITSRSISKRGSISYRLEEEKYVEPLFEPPYDPELEVPKFKADEIQIHAKQFMALVKMNYEGMVREQRIAMREYFSNFVATYIPLHKYDENPDLHYNTELIDAVFDRIQDLKHPCLDKLLSSLMILSRQVVINGQNNGREPRIERIFTVLKRSRSPEFLREACRALINYAEANSELFAEKFILELLFEIMTLYLQNVTLQTSIIWVLRNLSVTDECKKTILEKHAFLMVNAMNIHVRDLALVQNTCWALGNLALMPEAPSTFVNMGTLTSIKNAFASHPENEMLVEAVSWVTSNLLNDALCAKTMMRIGFIELFQKALASGVSKEIQESVQEIIGKLVETKKKEMEVVVRSGRIKIRGFLNRWIEKFGVLQAGSFVYRKDDKNLKNEGAIEISNAVAIEQDPNRKERIYIATKKKLSLIEIVDQDTVSLWLQDLRSVAKSIGGLPQLTNTHAQNSLTVAPEMLTKKEVERVCTMTALHVIPELPKFCKFAEKYAKSHPHLGFHDYALVMAAKEVTKQMVSSKLESVLDQDKNLYDGKKVRQYAVELSGVVFSEVSEKLEKEKVADSIKPPRTRYEYNAKQGIRPTMEDRHIHMPYIDALVDRNDPENPISYYAVYDGHGGISTADYIETHLHLNVMGHAKLNEDVPTAITESFMSTQEDFREISDRLTLTPGSGSTGVVCLIRGNKLFVAWVGDSECVLYKKNGDFEAIVVPHKCSNPDEKARIEKLGGFVHDESGVARVNGIVAVARAFGNLRLRCIVPEPAIREIDLTGEEQYMVLACDGLWDVMNGASVQKFISAYVKKRNKTKGISEALVDEALRLGSTDNVSVVFVEFIN